MSRTTERIQELIQDALERLRLPAERIDNQLLVRTLPPGGNTGSGYSPSQHAISHQSGGSDALALGALAGTLTDAQHGNRSGGSLHSVASAIANGFMSNSDKVKLDGIGAGASVSSVALSMPTQFAVAGTPVSSSGTLAVSWQNQSPNLVLAGPTFGLAAAPTFRALVAADIPDLDTSKIVSGQLSPARGGTGVDNATRTLTISTNGGTLAFAAASSTLTIPKTGTAPVGTGTAGRVAYWSGTNDLASDSAFNWDATNKRLGIGTASPASDFHLKSSGNAFATIETSSASSYAYFLLTTPSKSFQFALAGASAFNADNFYIFDQTANATRLMITSSGAVLVGKTSGLTGAGDLDVNGNTRLSGNVGFYNTSPVSKPTVTGSRGGNAALASLLTALANLGLITNSSSA